MTTADGAFLLAGRILFAGLFVFSARGHIQKHAQYVKTATGKLPLPFLAGIPAGLLQLLASVSIIAGIWPEIGCLMLLAFLLPTTLLFHPFWAIKDPAARRTQEGSFYRNVTLIGAALALFALFAAAGHVPFAVTGPAINLG